MTDPFEWPSQLSGAGKPGFPSAPGSGQSSYGEKRGGLSVEYSEYVRKRVEASVAEDYQVEDLLGVGGAAFVFRTRRRSDGKVLALKVLRDDQNSDAETVARFEREAELAMRLRHPNIVKTLGSIAIPPNGRALILEYMEAGNLSDFLMGSRRIPVETAVAILRDAALALEYAHGMGVIHRDVKPDNIFLGPNGRAKLGDFGIARQVGTQTLNLHGMAVGSTHYMSPEQIEGQETTARSDLYSLGCVAWQVLSGQAPWAWEPTLQGIIRRQLASSLPPLTQYRSDVPAHLVAIIDACLEKNPARRPATAQDFIRGLEGKVVVREVSKRPTPTTFTAATRRLEASALREVLGTGGRRDQKSARTRASPVSSLQRLRKRVAALPRIHAVGASTAFVIAVVLLVFGASHTLGSGRAEPLVPQTNAPPSQGLGQPTDASVVLDPPLIPSDLSPPTGGGEDNRSTPQEETDGQTGTEGDAPIVRSDPPPPPPVDTWSETRVRQTVEELLLVGRYAEAAETIRVRSPGAIRAQLLDRVSRICRAEQDVMRGRGLPVPECP